MREMFDGFDREAVDAARVAARLAAMAPAVAQHAARLPIKRRFRA
jgi:hypothetical protein